MGNSATLVQDWLYWNIIALDRHESERAWRQWHPTPVAPYSSGTPLQYSCLENPMDGGAWWAAVHGAAEGRTQLSGLTFTFHFHALEKEMTTHSSVLAWRIPGMGEPGGLPSMGSHRVGHDWSDLAAAAGRTLGAMQANRNREAMEFKAKWTLSQLLPGSNYRTFYSLPNWGHVPSVWLWPSPVRKAVLALFHRRGSEAQRGLFKMSQS